MTTFERELRAADKAVGKALAHLREAVREAPSIFARLMLDGSVANLESVERKLLNAIAALEQRQRD